MAAEGSGMKGFYVGLAVVALAGVGVLGYLMTRPTSVEIPADVLVTASDTAGFQGYALGSDSAPIRVTEYADYQCPYCQNYAVVQFPTIKERLIDAGLVQWRFKDFPLDQPHPNARLAAHAAACADDQGRYWQMHDAIFQGHPTWSVEPNATGTFRSYAQRIGLDVAAYDTCMREARHAGRIEGTRQEGIRLGVGSTPTFIMNGRRYEPRGMTYDALKALADSIGMARDSAE